MCADATAEIDVIWAKFAKDKNPELRSELITRVCSARPFCCWALRYPAN